MLGNFFSWLQAHGMATFVAAVAIFNIVLSGAAQIFSALGKQEPAWMQKLGAVGLKITQWLSANTPTPKS